MTVDDVTRMAKKYITPEKARIIVVGNKDEVMSKLVSFDKEDGKIQLYDIYANPRKDESATPVDVSANQVIDAYLLAVGGKAKLDAVQSIDANYTTELMGIPINARIVQSSGKFYMAMTGQGMSLMKQIFDGEKGVQEQMGNRTPLEGEDLVAMKEQANLFPERLYGTGEYGIEIKGIEDLNGKPAYKIIVTKPSGAKSTEYYDKESHLKVKEVQVMTDGQMQTFEFGDYSAENGVMVPHTITISGPMPAPMVMKATSVKINGDVDTMLFKI